MVQAISERLPTFLGARSRVRCFAHILNLVVKVFKLFIHCSFTNGLQSILVQFSRKPKKNGKEVSVDEFQGVDEDDDFAALVDDEDEDEAEDKEYDEGVTDEEQQQDDADRQFIQEVDDELIADITTPSVNNDEDKEARLAVWKVCVFLSVLFLV